MEELSSILKFISQIKKDEKLNTKYLYVSNNSYWTRFMRTFFENESRDSTYLFIQNNLYKTFSLLDSYINNNLEQYFSNNSDETSSSDNEISPLFIKSIINDLIKCKDGIINLQFTYQDDRIFICKLNTCILYIDSFLSKIYHKCPNVFPDNYICRINYNYKDIEFINEFSDKALKNMETLSTSNKSDFSPDFKARMSPRILSRISPRMSPRTSPCISPCLSSNNLNTVCNKEMPPHPTSTKLFNKNLIKSSPLQLPKTKPNLILDVGGKMGDQSVEQYVAQLPSIEKKTQIDLNKVVHILNNEIEHEVGMDIK